MIHINDGNVCVCCLVIIEFRNVTKFTAQITIGRPATLTPTYPLRTITPQQPDHTSHTPSVLLGRTLYNVFPPSNNQCMQFALRLPKNNHPQQQVVKGPAIWHQTKTNALNRITPRKWSISRWILVYRRFTLKTVKRQPVDVVVVWFYCA